MKQGERKELKCPACLALLAMPSAVLSQLPTSTCITDADCCLVQVPKLLVLQTPSMIGNRLLGKSFSKVPGVTGLLPW